MDDHHSTLGIGQDATIPEIRAAYLQLAKRWHPDRFLHDPALRKEAEDRMGRINEAYAALKNREPEAKEDIAAPRREAVPEADSAPTIRCPYCSSLEMKRLTTLDDEEYWRCKDCSGKTRIERRLAWPIFNACWGTALLLFCLACTWLTIGSARTFDPSGVFSVRHLVPLSFALFGLLGLAVTFFNVRDLMRKRRIDTSRRRKYYL